MIKTYLFDIEGTTTDINFVHKVLFPYAADSIESFVKDHQNEEKVAKAIQDVKLTVKEENQKDLDLSGVIQVLKDWIKADRKHGALKEIQGLIWDVGYSQGKFQGHLYPDVKPFFEKILHSKKNISIYSSGSVHAQKLIFGFSNSGDLTPMISHYFDTKVGGKRESNSYLKIAEALKLSPHEIHFFSDIAEELAAAQSAGMEVTQLLREEGMKSSFANIPDFHSFQLA